MGYTDGGSPHGGPVFNSTPQTVADLNKGREFTEEVGNHKTGTTAQRDAATGSKVWDGLFWSDTTDGNTYEYRNGGWRYFGGGNYLRTYGAWNGTVFTGNPIIMNGQAAGVTSGTGVLIWNFPKAFPNGCFYVGVQPHQNTGQLAESPPVLDEGNVNKNQFRVLFGGRPNTQVFLPYIAFGY
jgi:hypothetical protein